MYFITKNIKSNYGYNKIGIKKGLTYQIRQCKRLIRHRQKVANLELPFQFQQHL